MNLVVDVGNTLVKFAVFKDGHLIHKINFELSEFKMQYKALKKEFPKVRSGIISSVGSLSKTQIEIIEDDLTVIQFNSDIKLPFKNCYKTPTTLGEDRIALVCGAVHQFPDKNVLIVDAGTCITYDFITDKNDYLGGAISPGIRLRYKSLNNLTANLPLLGTSQPKTITGNSTESSIHSGVVFGVIKEIDGVMDHYLEKYLDLTIILTGGDGKFLSNQLKNSIFANSNFLLEGLNYILDYNSK
jgi:type III pantothenate kinase